MFVQWRFLLVSALCLGLVACAADGPARAEAEAALLERHTGEEVDRVRYTSIRGWWPAGDGAIVVEFNGRRHFLLDLSAPCDRELYFASSLRMDTSLSSLLTTFDRVWSESGWCRIERIRSFDNEGYREERRGRGRDFNAEVEVTERKTDDRQRL